MTQLIGVLGVISVLALMLWFVRKAGKDAVKADIGKANADASKRIAEAVSNAPGSKSDVLIRLRDRQRKL